MTREETCFALSSASEFCAERVYEALVAELWGDVVLYSQWMEVADRAAMEMSLPEPQKEDDGK